MATGTRVAGAASKPVAKARQGRETRAACTSCGVPLSSYNPGPNCYAHTLDLPWKGPGVRPR